jgi:hypothetical protein
LTVVEVKGNQVQVGIEAPDRVRILRGELACWHDGLWDLDVDGTPDWSNSG